MWLNERPKWLLDHNSDSSRRSLKKQNNLKKIKQASLDSAEFEVHDAATQKQLKNTDSWQSSRRKTQLCRKKNSFSCILQKSIWMISNTFGQIFFIKSKKRRTFGLLNFLVQQRISIIAIVKHGGGSVIIWVYFEALGLERIVTKKKKNSRMILGSMTKSCSRSQPLQQH